MIFAETVVQFDGPSLIAGLAAFGGTVAGGLVGAAKLITGVMGRLHDENRKDRADLMGVVNSQWEHLNRLAQSSRVTAQATRSIQQKVGAPSVPEDDP